MDLFADCVALVGLVKPQWVWFSISISISIRFSHVYIYSTYLVPCLDKTHQLHNYCTSLILILMLNHTH